MIYDTSTIIRYNLCENIIALPECIIWLYYALTYMSVPSAHISHWKHMQFIATGVALQKRFYEGGMTPPHYADEPPPSYGELCHKGSQIPPPYRLRHYIAEYRRKLPLSVKHILHQLHCQLKIQQADATSNSVNLLIIHGHSDYLRKLLRSPFINRRELFKWRSMYTNCVTYNHPRLINLLLNHNTIYNTYNALYDIEVNKLTCRLNLIVHAWRNRHYHIMRMLASQIDWKKNTRYRAGGASGLIQCYVWLPMEYCTADQSIYPSEINKILPIIQKYIMR